MNLKIKKITKNKIPNKTTVKSKVKKKSLTETTPIKAQGEDRYYKQVDEKPFGMNDILIYFYEKYEGDWDEIYKAIRRKEAVNSEQAKKFLKGYKDKYEYVTIIDKNIKQIISRLLL